MYFGRIANMRRCGRRVEPTTMVDDWLLCNGRRVEPTTMVDDWLLCKKGKKVPLCTMFEFNSDFDVCLCILQFCFCNMRINTNSILFLNNIYFVHFSYQSRVSHFTLYTCPCPFCSIMFLSSVFGISDGSILASFIALKNLVTPGGAFPFAGL